MKKSNVFVALYSLFQLFWFLLPGQAQAQCSPWNEAIPGFDLSYELTDNGTETRVRFYLDYASHDGDGAYGIKLQAYLPDKVYGVSGVSYDLSGSWLFANTSLSVDAHYVSATHSVVFEVSRLDCAGAEGDGFIGEVIISRSGGAEVPLESLAGCIVMVDNVDAT